MADNKYPPPLRPESKRAQVYNDGLAVYLYDESLREGLRSESAWEKINTAFEAEKPDKELKKFLSSRRFVSYELQQDDSVVVDIAVGPPLTPAELKARKGVKWLKPQKSIIHLPTGKLRIESANSCQIGAEDTNEEGVTIEIPSGNYLLTLHRLDWDSMGDEMSNDPKIVGETITLTPFIDAEPAGTYSAVLRFPVKKPSNKWLGAYAIEGNTFKGQAIFPDFWEFICLNLDRAAFEKMGLGFGSVLDVEALNRKFTVVYLGESIQYGIMQLAGYKLLFGKDRMTAEIAKEPEVAIGVFVKQPETQHEILCCMRVNAKESIPNGKNGKWMKATAVVRAQKLEPIDRNDFGKWKQDGGALRATVLLRTPRYMTLNLDSSALEAAGIRPGDTIRIRAGNFEQKALFVATNADMAKALAASEPKDEARDAYMALRVKLFSASETEQQELLAQMRKIFLKEPPLVACLDQYWLDKSITIFLTTPLAVDKESIKLTFQLDFPVKAGDPAIVSKV